MLTRSTAVTGCRIPPDILCLPRSALDGRTCRYGSTTESSHCLNPRKSSLRGTLSHGLDMRCNKTLARFMTTSVTAKIDNLVDNNKVR